MIQFVAFFGELKKEVTEWPTFGNRQNYWDKAAAFVQYTAGTEFQRSGKSLKCLSPLPSCIKYRKF